MRPVLLATTLALTGCGEAIWLPAVELPWGEETGVAAERMADDCAITFDRVLMGLPSGALSGDGEEVAPLPMGRAMQLVGASPATLGEVRISDSSLPTDVTYRLGPPGEAPDGAAAGNASPDERMGLIGVSVTFSVSCGADVVTSSFEAGPLDVACGLPDEIELDAQSSFGTHLVFELPAWFGDAPEGSPWVAADDGDGLLTAEERRGVVDDQAVRDALVFASDAGPCVVSDP